MLKPPFNNARHLRDRNRKPAGVVPDNPGDAVENIRTGAGPRRQAATPPPADGERSPGGLRSATAPGENPTAAIAPGRNPRRTYYLRGNTAHHRAGTMDANMREAEQWLRQGDLLGARNTCRSGNFERACWLSREIANSTVIRPGVPADPGTPS